MLRLHLPVTLFAALATGCYGGADVAYTASYQTPTMAYVSPGVQVVYDYDYPVFFADGYYWRYSNDRWYSSPYYNRGWSVNYRVPVAVRGIHEPWRYSHYRGGHVVRRGPIVRDHRRY